MWVVIVLREQVNGTTRAVVTPGNYVRFDETKSAKCSEMKVLNLV